MKRERRLARIEKSRMFSQKEAVALSGFTRRQLETLEKLEVITPYRNPAVLYSWRQLIFLRIIYYFRQIWSLQQIDKALKNFTENIDIETVINTIDEIDIVYFAEGGTIGNLTIYIQFNKCTNVSEIERKGLHRMMEEMPRILTDDGLLQGQGKITTVVVPKIVAELKDLAKNLDIENLELKFG